MGPLKETNSIELKMGPLKKQNSIEFEDGSF